MDAGLQPRQLVLKSSFSLLCDAVAALAAIGLGLFNQTFILKLSQQRVERSGAEAARGRVFSALQIP